MLKWAKALIKGTRVDQTREGLGHPAQCITLIEINEQKPQMLKVKFNRKYSMRFAIRKVQVYYSNPLTDQSHSCFHQQAVNCGEYI